LPIDRSIPPGPRTSIVQVVPIRSSTRVVRRTRDGGSVGLRHLRQGLDKERELVETPGAGEHALEVRLGEDELLDLRGENGTVYQAHRTHRPVLRNCSKIK